MQLLLVGLFLSLLSHVAVSRTVLELDAASQPVNLADWGEYWIDSQAQLGPEQVAAGIDQTWNPTLSRGNYPLRARQALWIKFTVPPAPDSERWLLEIPYPALDRASLYIQDKAGQWNEQRAGDLTPINRWPTPHRYPLLRINVNAEEPTRYMLRIENAQGFSAPIRFVNDPYVLRDAQRVALFLGLYFGMALFGCVIGLVGVLWLRDRARDFDFP